MVVGRTYEHWATLSQTGYRLTRDIVVSNQAAAICIALKSVVVELAEYLVHIYRNAEQLLVLLEQSYPCIEVGSTVVAVNHSYRTTVWSCHHINDFVRFAQGFLQHDHRERWSTCTYVTGALTNSVGSYHTCTCITLWRAERSTSLESARWVELLCSFLGKNTCIFACVQYLWENVENLPAQVLRLDELVELSHHLSIVVVGVGIDREHTWCVAYAKHLLASELPVDVTGERGEEVNLVDVLFTVQDSLINVRDTPTQWDVEVEELWKLGCCLGGVGIAPGAERNEDILILAESHVAVHHCRNTDGSQLLDFAIVLCLHVLAEVSVAILQTFPDGFDAVSPQAINQLVFPLKATLCDRVVIGVD